ncbi:unnamed protein product [Pelagomonas calceolata]|uniref:Uncharacterized protein n=1 Tax=Pelagomonas calceolata TaxID=35677 RepID=A0A8J2T1I4_9STRA|nr:unnamed protein product [Pelagomonas calceolata]
MAVLGPLGAAPRRRRSTQGLVLADDERHLAALVLDDDDVLDGARAPADVLHVRRRGLEDRRLLLLEAPPRLRLGLGLGLGREEEGPRLLDGGFIARPAVVPVLGRGAGPPPLVVDVARPRAGVPLGAVRRRHATVEALVRHAAIERREAGIRRLRALLRRERARALRAESLRVEPPMHRLAVGAALRVRVLPYDRRGHVVARTSCESRQEQPSYEWHGVAPRLPLCSTALLGLPLCGSCPTFLGLPLR